MSVATREQLELEVEAMGYDIRCEDLAHVFLVDEPWSTEADAKELAQAVQDAVEEWLELRRPAAYRKP